MLANDLPAGPRERLLRCGPESISDRELLAIVLGTGTRGVPVQELAGALLEQLGGVEALAQARSDGVGIFIFGDDSAYRMDKLPDPGLGEDLVGLAPTSNNGSRVVIGMEEDSTHPAFSGPYGDPEPFEYRWDVDVTELARPHDDVHVDVLAWRAGSANPAWVAAPGRTGRTP